MSQLSLIIKNEYISDIRSKSFWIGTFLMPVLCICFGVFVAFMMEDSDAMKKVSNPTAPDPSEMTGLQAMGMLAGVFLAMFLMIYGSMIFNKVKKEKTNRIIEVLATSVTGRTMMLGKVISVGLIGLTQLFVWVSMIILGVVFVITIIKPDIPWHELARQEVYWGILWTLLFFIGGYVFYGSIYAACGAMTDKDNENQGYMTAITFLLLGSFYIGQYAATHPENPFVIFCSLFPFTSPTIGTVNAVSGEVSFWMSLLSLIILYVCAFLSISLAGKIYTSSLLLKGKKFTPKDILVFLKSK